MELKVLQEKLCKSLCAEVHLYPKGTDYLFVNTPFTFSDGDVYSIYLRSHGEDKFRVTDLGHTLMHLSYDNDIDKFRQATRGRLFEQILMEMDIQESDGELFTDATTGNIGETVLRYAQSITKITDLTFLNRARVESTFYDDLMETLKTIVDENKIKINYIIHSMPNAEDYPVDYRIEGKEKEEPLFILGIPGRDKARLATIILEHLLREGIRFNSLLVFSNQQEIPRRDLARLSNVGGEMVASLDATDDLSRKVLKRVA